METGKRLKRFLAFVMMLLYLTGELAQDVYAASVWENGESGDEIGYEIDKGEFQTALTEMLTQQVTDEGSNPVDMSDSFFYTFHVEKDASNVQSGGEHCLELNQSDPVYMWFTSETEEDPENLGTRKETQRNIYIGCSEEEKKLYFPEDCSNLFGYLSNHDENEEIHTNLDIARGKLQSIDLSGINTSHVTNMSGMFQGCTGVTALDFSGFDTSSVTNMSRMFQDCQQLTSFSLTGFNTANVANMSDMFQACNSITRLDLSSFNTLKVTNMSSMFQNCESLDTIWVAEGWNTGAVIESENMFEGCSTYLQGGNGTKYNNSNPKDKTYARIDAEGTPGYLTSKIEYTISVSVNTISGYNTPPGSAVISKDAEYTETTTAQAGVILNLKAVPADGFVFKKWELIKGDGIIGYETNAITTFTTKASVAELQAVFVAKNAVLTVAEPHFDPVVEGYPVPDAQMIQITNAGNVDAQITDVTHTNGTDFILQQTGVSSNEVVAGQTNTSWTIQPKVGLTSNDYNDTITVTYHETGKEEAKEASTTVTFTVQAPSLPKLQSIPQAGPLEFASGTEWSTVEAAVRAVTTVSINATESINKAKVTWLESSISENRAKYQNSSPTDQEFVIEGTITLPNGLDPDGADCMATIKVIVKGTKTPVAAPKASVSSNVLGTAYTQAQSVSLTSDTTNAAIYYTMQQTEMTDTSTSAVVPADPNTSMEDQKYSEPIPLSGREGETIIYVIKAVTKAVDEGTQVNSSVQTFRYYIRIPKRYTITTAVSGNTYGTATAQLQGSSESAGFVKEEAGKLVTLTASANMGYQFDHWEVQDTKVDVDGTTVSSNLITEYNKKNNPLSVKIPDQDVTVTAHFIEKTIELTVTPPTFKSVAFQYSQPDAKYFTIANTGNTDAENITVSLNSTTRTVNDVQTVLEESAFELTGSADKIPKGGKTINWRLRPNAGLYVGTYKTQIIVTYKDAKAEEKQVSADVTFEVNQSKLLSVVTPSALNLEYGKTKQEIQKQLPKEVTITTENSAQTSASVSWNMVGLDEYRQYEDKYRRTYTLEGTVTGLAEYIDPTAYLAGQSEDKSNVTVTIEVHVSAAGQAAKPTASYAWQSESADGKNITLNSNTGDAAIYYLLFDDAGISPAPYAGSVSANDLIKEENRYTGTISLNGVTGKAVTYTIYAIATKDQMNHSDIGTFTFSVANYEISVQNSEGGTASVTLGTSVSDNQIAKAGASMTLSAEAEAGWRFIRWEETVSGASPFITGDNQASQAISVTMPARNVGVRPVFEKMTNDLSVTAPAFSQVLAGYAAQEAKAVTLTNSGNTVAAVTAAAVSAAVRNPGPDQENVDAFELSGATTATVLAGGTNTTSYQIRPKDGLPAGTYHATITVTYQDVADAAKTHEAAAQVTFVVQRPKLLGVQAFEPVTNIPNGTSMAALKALLPAEASVTTEENMFSEATIVWDEDHLAQDYDEDQVTEQTITVSGQLSLDQIDPNGMSDRVSVKLTILAADQVETPVSLLAEDEIYTENPTLTLSANTPGSQIYYTIATGDEIPVQPKAGDAGSRLYDGAFTIEGTAGMLTQVTVKAIAVKNKMRDSETATFTYRIQLPAVYTITVQSSDQTGGSATAALLGGTPSSSVTARKGSYVTLTATTLNSSYLFTGWETEGGYGNLIAASDRTKPSVTVQMPAENVTVKAVFEEKNNTLTITAPAMTDEIIGYENPQAKAIVLTNNGNIPAENVIVEVTKATKDDKTSGIGVNAFTVEGSKASVSANGGTLSTWKIRPQTGLELGTYYAQIVVTYDSPTGGSRTESRADISLKVIKSKLLEIKPFDTVTSYPYGTDVETMAGNLPDKVQIVTAGDRYRSAAVAWKETDFAGYERYKLEKQTIVVNGTITFPDLVDADDMSKEVRLTLTVDQAPKADMPQAILDTDTVYTENQMAALSCNTAGAKIYYTMTSDGSEPEDPMPEGAASAKYIEPFLLEGVAGKPVTFRIKAVAVKEHMFDSDVASFTYQIKLPSVYDLTVVSSEGGTAAAAIAGGTPAEVVTAREGWTVTLDARPDAKYLFKNWEVVSGNGIRFADAGGSRTTMAMPKGDAVVRAVFEPKILDLSMEVPSFRWAQGQYVRPEAGVITIKNSGNIDMELELQMNGTGFELGKIAGEGEDAAGSSRLPSDKDLVAAGGQNATWTIQPEAGLTAGQYEATISMVYTDLDGKKQSVSKTVNFVVYDASLSILESIDEIPSPEPFENGTDVETLFAALPKTVSINTTASETEAGVSWSLDEVREKYNTETLEEQTFTISGTARLYNRTINPDDIPLDVQVSVRVKAAPKADAPTESPKAGRYTENQMVTLSDNTPDVDIYYTMTTDGSDPKTPRKGAEGSIKYDTPVSVCGIHGQTVKVTIKAVAVPKDGIRLHESDEKTFVYTMELPPLYEMAVTHTEGGTIEVSADEANEVSMSQETGAYLVKALEGTTVMLKAWPDALYLFKGWEVVSGNRVQIADRSFTETSVKVPNENAAIRAVFEKKSISLSVNTPEFEKQEEDYGMLQAGTVTIRNEGNVETVITDVQVDSTDFVLQRRSASGNTVSGAGDAAAEAGGSGEGAGDAEPVSGNTVSDNVVVIPAGGESSEWTIMPAAGLKAGTYEAQVLVTYLDVDGVSKRKTAVVTFTVLPKTLTVTFDANGGSGSMEKVVTKRGQEVELPANTFTAPSGKVFLEWAIGSADGSRVKAGATYVFTDDTTVYALWEDIPVIQPQPEVKPTPQPQPQPQPDPVVPTTPAQTFKVTKKMSYDNAVKLNAGLKVTTSGAKITVKWGKVKDANGYLVYAAYSGTKFTSGTLAKTITKKATTSTTVTKIKGKKLDKKKQYQVYVAAYKLVNGKKVIIGTSLTAYVVGSGNKTYSNVKKVTVNQKKVTLRLKKKSGKTFRIKAKATLVYPKRKKQTNAQGKEFRYASSDKSIATVSAKGKITAKAKGKCTIYVYARNGNAGKITVTVK